MAVSSSPATTQTTGVHDISSSACLPVHEVLRELVSTREGLSAEAAAERLRQWGPNAVASHKARVLPVLWRQMRSPLLGLLFAAATISYVVGRHSDAVIIGVILTLSVGLGFVNEYRAEKAAEALHGQISHQAVVIRGGRVTAVEVTALVPGDVVKLRLGDIVPADLRLLEVTGLECGESVLTGESLPVPKDTAAVSVGVALAELSCCALMGTVVHAGSARAVVVATGTATEFGKIAAGLSGHQLETEFQRGLRRFSMLLVYVAGTLTTSIFVINVVLHKPLIDSLLFSLAIAVGITPQLLPAVVSSSLAAGSRRMSRQKVLVKRLVCIEDLGDVDVLFTDKTGTLTQGHIEFKRALPAGRQSPEQVLKWGLLCTDVDADGSQILGGNPLDTALWEAATAQPEDAHANVYQRVGMLPFDHERRMFSTVVRDPMGGTVLVTKGAPESVLERCENVPEQARTLLATEFAAGNRVVAVATRSAPGLVRPAAADEHGLELAGLLVFLDPPKPDAAAALLRLAGLGVTVKIVTGDNPAVAVRVCHDLGLTSSGTITGTDLDAMDDARLRAAIAHTTVFARVSPQHKARIVRVQRTTGHDVAFLGDGVNDALALHAADVGISVDSATDVAKDAADVILLEKDLDVLADGVVGGRRIFANTIKYVLMGTSSNFGNMFSAAGASLFLGFLPMLPSQILLNNLLYDTSQLAIPTDRVDEAQLRRPSHWDIRFIRRFMIFFGPLSSVFDFATFGVMLWVFHSGPAQFRTGWFVESLATQTLVIFAIRTRRIPFWRSHPSLPLTLAALGVVSVGVLLPATPLAARLGFQPLPLGFFVALVAMVICYLALIEVGKRIFYRWRPTPIAEPGGAVGHSRLLRRRAARFSTALRPHHRPRPVGR
ncbi:magnesium-translocating P-type ATPase [Streptomyces lunaelactis]|nr:magnesium-translocating P-type ATPase [Streptomyces lunaelactis]NUK16762.1 magnesium-translocating P-type ATPase [Streptomyces lunaelactis]NUK35733.1 magnesium-translocating P-type ATPase [Streptomyces lunaelactis]NUK41347.1 magnesium-translocating P-type ATPase [Streptomyces lunaelactis]NUK51668.1 magnesium-translocating P-type ATPase [Streptomyces lunaelactis]